METSAPPKTAAELDAAAAELKAQADGLRKQEKTDAIARIKTAMAEYGITAADLGIKGGESKRNRTPKSGAKYRNPTTGETWTGKGRNPKWVSAIKEAGGDMAAYTVQ